MAVALGVEGSFRLGDVFQKSFRVFGRHPVACIAIGAVALSPFYLMRWALLTAALGRAPGTAGLVVLWGTSLTFFMIFICPTLANGAMTYCVVQDLRGRPAPMLEMLNVLARRLPPMLGIAVSMPLIVLLLVLGFFLLLTAIAVVGTQAFSPTATAWSVVASGLVGVALLSSIAVVYCMFFVAAPVCIAEQAGIRTSFSRSRFLTKGHRWQIFGAFILIFVVGLIANVAAAVLASRMGAGTQGLIMSYLVQAVFIAFNAVVAAVFYHQLRVAKHGIDIANIANVFD